MQLDAKMLEVGRARSDTDEKLGKIQASMSDHKVARSRLQNKIRQLEKKIELCVPVT
jgi:chromosome segregation ATPase